MLLLPLYPVLTCFESTTAPSSHSFYRAAHTMPYPPLTGSHHRVSDFLLGESCRDCCQGGSASGRGSDTPADTGELKVVTFNMLWEMWLLYRMPLADVEGCVKDLAAPERSAYMVGGRVMVAKIG